MLWIQIAVGRQKMLLSFCVQDGKLASSDRSLQLLYGQTGKHFGDTGLHSKRFPQQMNFSRLFPHLGRSLFQKCQSQNSSKPVQTGAEIKLREGNKNSYFFLENFKISVCFQDAGFLFSTHVACGYKRGRGDWGEVKQGHVETVAIIFMVDNA